MKTSIIRDMQQSNQTVHTVSTSDADKLVDAGYVRRVTLDPPVRDGKTAISLTAAGRGWQKGDTEAPELPMATDEAE